ncbi:MAG: hypothetical protein PHF23_04505 [Smithellaceae bacterium]|nr:hypothetical protein [Smithellaceae bacterium]
MEIVEKSIVCKRPALPDETSGLDGAFAFRLPVDFFWATVPDEWFLLELTAIDSQPPHFKPERRKNSFEVRHSINTKANEIKSSLFYLFVLPAQETVSQFLFCHLWKRSATRNPLLLKDYGFPPGDCGNDKGTGFRFRGDNAPAPAVHPSFRSLEAGLEVTFRQ